MLSIPPPDNDLSVTILRDIFGPVWDYVFHGTTTVGAPGTAGGIINVLFEIMGYVMSFSLGLVILVIMLLAIIHTANQGEPLGKNMDTFWTPVKAAVSMLLVWPLPSLGGYSLIHALIVLMVGISVSTANFMFSKVNEHFAQYGTLMPMSNAQPSNAVMRQILMSETCTKVVNRELDPYGLHIYRIAKRPSSTGKLVLYYGSDASMKSFPECGMVVLDCKEIKNVAETSGTWLDQLKKHVGTSPVS